MTLLFDLLLAVAVGPPVDVPILNPRAAAAHVRACGLRHVRVKSDPDLEEDVVEVSHVSTATDVQLRCVAQQSLAWGTYVEFPERLNQTYQKVYFEIADAAARIHARVWLDRRGLLAKLPTYVKGQTDDLTFARRLEGLCGPQARGAYVRDHGRVILKPGNPEQPAIDNGTFECLLNATTASGFPMSFVGNEYYSKPRRAHHAE
jgi:hypothetical protein